MKRTKRRRAERIRKTGLVLLLGFLVSGQKCDVEKRVCNERPGGKLVNRDGKISCEYPNDPTTTTSSTSTTTTTTSTTTSTTFVLPTTTTTTLPPIAPSPTPTCIPEQPMPSGPVDVRNGLKPSSCDRTGTNNACWREPFDHSNGKRITPPGDATGHGHGAVPWERDEGFCWPAWEVARQWGESTKTFGGVTLHCQAGYPEDADDRRRGCFDAWGRRYQWDGAAWREERLPGYAWSWTNGICPPRAPKTCPTMPPTPGPTPTPSGPGPQPSTCYAGPWRMHCRFESCDIQGEPGASAFEGPVAEVARRLFGEVEREVPNESLTEHGNALARELRAAGFCVATHEDKSARVSDDEIAVWSPSNPRKEHLDFGRATGATPGFSVLLHRPFMVARGIP